MSRAGRAHKNASPVDIQKSELEKLLNNPEKAIKAINGIKIVKTGDVTGETVRNKDQLAVVSSISAAGSGDFHLYKNTKRRELDKQGEEERLIQKKQDDEEFERKRKEAEQRDNARTQKNRERRKKRRLKENRQDSAGPSATNGSHSTETPLQKNHENHKKSPRPQKDSDQVLVIESDL
ncbi:hypothetical protein AWJ20_4440 [Sugiyamaella lignohabitans]|uniref:Uncharacterized protein n=1 Tax=Sugiyamaella lignohabitans TaxID=796027 RepID=A0A167CFE2_9ASCO|nr:uncharacterized protein AWJ20_4440 [Sugiyamaella lignohabitans]ANB11619.1 hypothetical protein AWJ20_4440 [Sugiyamaella lignohabitans]